MAIGNQEEDRMSENEGTSKRARGGWISGSQPSEFCVFSFFFSHLVPLGCVLCASAWRCQAVKGIAGSRLVLSL